MPCPTCSDTGWTGWEKPMSDGRRGIRMVFVPQVCVCKAGDAAASRYEQNVTSGKAGRDGEPPVTTQPKK
jgi:hypothetical protein